MAMTDEEYQDFVNRANYIRNARNALVRRSPIGSAAAGLRETYSQAGKELTEASRQPSFAGRTGSALGALARMPGRFLGATAADMYKTAEQVAGAGAESLGRFGRALVSGSETETPVAASRAPAFSPPVPNAADVAKSGARRETTERPASAAEAAAGTAAAIPTRNVITDSQGNRTYIDPETGNPRTISASGQDITGQRRKPFVRGEADETAASPSRLPSRRVATYQGPPSPDYSSPPAPPSRLADMVNPNATFGEYVTTGRRQLRAATADQQADLKREDLAQRASSEGMDRLLRAADIAQRGQISEADLQQRWQSDKVDQDLRRQQLEQSGAYQQGELGLRKEDLAAKAAEAGAERSAEAARQQRLNAALNIYDDPKAPPEAKQRAQRIIEANQGKASFDLGEKPMTQEAAQKSLQDTWKAVAGSDTPLDPSSVEQLQGVAQANPGAWKAVHGNASPAQVQKYNALSRLQPADIAKDPVISALIKKSGGGESPEEARIILEELIRKQRGF
jgi:hypothetical protein